MSTEELVLKWGIISCGRIAQDFCTALSSLKSPKHQVVAIAEINKEAAEKFEVKKVAEKFHIPSFYDSFDPIFANNDVNIVYIATLNISHKELSIKALNAGKHVLCEKPVAMNTKELEEILAASKANNKFFMEALWTRHFPVITRLKQELKDKSIGDLKFFSSIKTDPISTSDRIRLKELGGGGIYDLGGYPIQLACLVFDHEKPIKITATGHLMDTGVDESCSITMLYSGGRLAVVSMSTVAFKYEPTYIYGDKGVMQIPEMSSCPLELVLPNGEVFKGPQPEQDIKTNYRYRVFLRYQAESTYEAISKGWIEHPNATHDNSRLICHIMEEARNQLGYTSL